MEYRSPQMVTRLTGLLLALALAGIVHAEDETVSFPGTLQQAQAMQRDAASIRRQAEEEQTRAYLACDKKLLVNNCRNEAHRVYLEKLEGARAQNAQGRALEQQIRGRERDAKHQAQEADEARRAAKLSAREARVAAARQQKIQARDAKLLKKEAQAEAGARQQAERQAEQYRKRAEHNRLLQEKKEKVEQRDPPEGAADQ